MKYIASIVLTLLCLNLFVARTNAQTIDQASASFQEFNRLRLTGGTKEDVYTALYKSYKEYAAIVVKSAPNSSDYLQAKNGLREVYPFLQEGARYYSSKGDNKTGLMFAQSFMDIPLMNAFRGENFVKDNYFPTMAYFAASGSFNARDYSKAIAYFRAYLNTGDQVYRQRVYTAMAASCVSIKNSQLTKEVVNEGLVYYPDNMDLLKMAINNCLELEEYGDDLRRYVSKALTIRPNDESLLAIQGKLCEETNDFKQALSVYNKLLQMKPNSLSLVKHIALNYYNLGVMNFNEAALSNDSLAVSRYMDISKDYFTSAAANLQNVVANDPSSVKYMQALAMAYNCMGEQSQFDAVNAKLATMGGGTIAKDAIPELISYSDKAKAQVSQSGAGALSTEAYINQAIAKYGENTPLYSAFAKEYVESRLREWQTKDPYETISEYQARVNNKARDGKVQVLKKEAEDIYLKAFTRNIKLTNLILKPYDAENRVFLVESEYGEIIVPVPRENNEAKIFESSWSGVQIKNPEYYINNDKIMISALTFTTPMGKTYQYDGDKGLNYVETVVDISFDEINTNMFAQNANQQGNELSHVKKKDIRVGTVMSDVDENIPEITLRNDKTFAVIISNENYTAVAPVPMALRDGEILRQYCMKTLGMPKYNIRYYKDASYGAMLRAMSDLENIVKTQKFPGELNIIFYYAGHGIPNEATKDAFLMPVDADGTHTEACYPLSRLYSELGALGVKQVTVFLDACFSGANRDGQMLASARGIALKAKTEAPQGNMVIFSAASNDETAFPYKEKGHGLFTYFLLKKLQESKGTATLGELADYISTNVKQQSVLVNQKLQSPTAVASMSMMSTWQNATLATRVPAIAEEPVADPNAADGSK